MDIFGVVYTSRAVRPMSPEDLDRLLVSARLHNAEAKVTGVLLYAEKQFFQYFEGTRASVDAIYERIRRSSLHADMLELEHGPVAERRFSRWYMGFRKAPASVLQKLSHEQWEREAPWAESHAKESPGMQRLLDFWREAAG